MKTDFIEGKKNLQSSLTVDYYRNELLDEEVYALFFLLNIIHIECKMYTIF